MFWACRNHDLSPFLLNSNNFVCVFKAVAQCCALWQKFCCRFSIFARATQLRSTIIRNFQSCQAIIHTLHDRRGDRNCPRSFLQVSIFNVQLHAQKDHNSNEIFVMGPAHCAGPMTNISLLLWFFCARYLSLKIVVCKKLQGQIATCSRRCFLQK